MDTLTDNSKSSFQPSLLRQIVDEVDAMNDEEKQEILRKIKMQRAKALALKLDKALEGNWLPLTEDEIAEMVSKDRRERYEQSLGA